MRRGQVTKKTTATSEAEEIVLRFALLPAQ
jgi:hypothetical protein